MDFLQIAFILSLVVATIISFYYFMMVLVFKHKKYKNVFNSWQFPMLLAILVEVFFLEDVYNNV